jgi:hypothetical protein
MEPLKERIAIKALHPKPQEVDRDLLARVEVLGASLRPTTVVRLVHPRLNLFAKLKYNNVVGSLKADPRSPARASAAFGPGAETGATETVRGAPQVWSERQIGGDRPGAVKSWQTRANRWSAYAAPCQDGIRSHGKEDVPLHANTPVP